MMNIVVSQQPLKINTGEVVANKVPTMSYGEFRSQFEGDNSGQMGFLDMFMAQLEGNEDGTDIIDALLAGTAEADKDSEEEGTTLAMQFMAEMLSNTAATNNLLQQVAEQNPDLVAQLQTMATNGSVTPLQNGALEQMQALNQQGQTTRAETSNTVTYTDYDPDLVDGGTKSTDIIATSMNVSSGNGDAEETPESLFGGESQFSSNIAEAKKMLKTNNQDSALNYSAIDVDKLQNNADASRLNAAKTTESSPLPEAKEVFSQLKAGVKENVSAGKSEFTIKLQPEGLGEITVKLVETDNKMTLSLMTSNTQVAKMLSNEIGLLRETMKPYNVEVREIVNQAASSNATLNTTANDNFAQSFAGQQGEQYAREGMLNYFFDDDSDSQGFQTDMLNVAASLGGLDTRI